MGFKKRDIVMNMIKPILGTSLIFPEDGNKVQILVDCSLEILKYLSFLVKTIINTGNGNENTTLEFLESVDDAFISQHVMRLHTSMSNLAQSLGRPYELIYVTDSKRAPFKKLDRSPSHIFSRAHIAAIGTCDEDDPSRLIDMRLHRAEIINMLTFTDQNILEYIDEELPTNLKLAQIVVDGEVPIEALLKQTGTEYPSEAWKKLLSYRNVHGKVMDMLSSICYKLNEMGEPIKKLNPDGTVAKKRDAAGNPTDEDEYEYDSIPVARLATMLSIHEHTLWESIRSDTRVQKYMIYRANKFLSDCIINAAKYPEFNHCQIVGHDGSVIVPSISVLLDDNEMSEADDIIMRIINKKFDGKRRHSIIVSADADTAGWLFWQWHAETWAAADSPVVYWMEKWKENVFYEMSAFHKQAIVREIMPDNLDLYLRSMVLLWVLYSNNDFVFLSIKAPEITPQLISRVAKDIGDRMYNKQALASWIDGHIASLPKGTSGTYIMVKQPNGKRKKIELVEAKKNSTAEHIANVLEYMTLKDIRYIN